MREAAAQGTAITRLDVAYPLQRRREQRDGPASKGVPFQGALPWPAEVTHRPGRIYWQVTAYPQGGTDADGVDSPLVRFDHQP